VFLDETWIYQNGSAIRRWVHDTDVKSNPSVVKTEGKRFTILHAVVMKNLKSRPGREPGLTRPTIRRRGVRNSVLHERHGFSTSRTLPTRSGATNLNSKIRDHRKHKSTRTFSNSLTRKNTIFNIDMYASKRSSPQDT
jgi:hypothetical protein